MQIFVRSLTGNLIMVEAESSDTIDNVISMIQAQRDPIFNPSVSVHDVTNISFKRSIDAKFKLEVEGGSYTIGNAKGKTHDNKGIPFDPIKLYYHGNPLIVNRTLYAYNIGKESTLHFCGRMTIFIISLTDYMKCLEVESSDTIENVKCMIHEMNDTLPEDQRLMYVGKELEDKQTLAEYHIQSLTALYLSSMVCPFFHIFVKTPTGKMLLFDVVGADMIESTKSMIVEKGLYLPNEQRLFYDGEELEDKKQLYDYGLQDFDTLELHLKS